MKDGWENAKRTVKVREHMRIPATAASNNRSDRRLKKGIKMAKVRLIVSVFGGQAVVTEEREKVGKMQRRLPIRDSRELLTSDVA